MPEATSSTSAAGIIGSIKDVRVASLRGLTTAAARRSAGLCLIEGRSLIGQILDGAASAAVMPIRTAVRAEGARRDEDEDLARRLRAAGVAVHRSRDGVVRQLAGARRPVDWLATATQPTEHGGDEPWGELAVVCENIEDPGNLGSIVRSARALGADELVVTDADTDMSARRVLEASRGTVLATRVRRFSCPAAALAALHTAGFQVVVTSPRGRQVQALTSVQGQRVALVVGNETTGVSADSEAAADVVVQIPMSGRVESPNVGVVAGISLYELRTRMVLAMLTDRIRATLGREIALTGRRVRMMLDQAMRTAAGLSSNQVITLMIVAAERATPHAELGADLGVGSAELAELVEPLQDAGWLRSTDTGQTLVITPAGEQALAGLRSIQQRVEDELCADLSDTERDTLVALLQRVQHTAQKHLTEGDATGTPDDRPPES